MEITVALQIPELNFYEGCLKYTALRREGQTQELYHLHW